MIIDISKFFGEIPKVNPRLLPDGYAVKAENCLVDSGKLQAMNGVSTIQAVEAGTNTIYKMQDSFLEWASIVNVVKSLIADSGERIFYTGDGYPKDTNAALALSGDGPYPDNSRRLGIPAPTNALTVTFSGTAGEDVDRVASYVYTLVGKWDDGSAVESGPSQPTAVFDVYEGITLALSGFADSVVAGAYTTHFRIYRLSATGYEYQYVDEVTISTSSYSDLVTDGDLGEVIPCTTWLAADDALEGLLSTSHGLVFGFVGNTIYPSEIFIQYAFPSGYTLTTESDIVGLGYTGSMVLVVTKTVPYILYGSSPESLSLTRLGYQQPCLSRRSIVDVPGGVIYACPDGLFMISESGAGSNITKNIFKKSQWKALGPEDVIGIYYDDSYFCFFNGTTDGFRLNLESGEYQPLTMEANVYGIHYSPIDDLIYLIQASGESREIVSWDSGGLVDYTWLSKEYVCGNLFMAGMIESDFNNGPIEVALYVDGVVEFYDRISNDNIFFIPVFDGSFFQIEVSGKSTLDRIIIAQNYDDIVERLQND